MRAAVKMVEHCGTVKGKQARSALVMNRWKGAERWHIKPGFYFALQSGAAGP